MFVELNENESDHQYFCIPKNMLSINICLFKLCMGGMDVLALFAIICVVTFVSMPHRFYFYKLM